LRILKPGEVIIEALPEVSTKGSTINDVNVLMDNVYKMMNETFVKNSKEIKSRKI
jgi:hypothetical protein